MSVPAVSVLMPVYNAQRYVAEAVQSILTQTMGDFEFIIIDDGSTDDSTRILRDWAQRDSRIRLVSRPNTGLCVALNEGLAMANGRYIARMDADDISLPQRFALQLEYLKTHEKLVCIGGSFLLIDAAGRMLTRLDPARG